MTSRRIGLAILTAALLAVAPAHADSNAAARAHFATGSKLYQQGRYDEALAELTAGYELDPRPEFLYSLGQTERKRRHFKEALDYYQRYLDSGLPRERAAAVLIQMDRCRAELARPAPPPPASPPQQPLAIAPPPVTTPTLIEPPPPPRKPAYKRWYVWTPVVLVAAAGVGLGLGLTLGRESKFQPTLPDLVVK
jgi:tetratricopeptide (TPR) repeat protein